MDYAAKFEQGLDYADFLAKYATDDQKARWAGMEERITLTDAQRTLLSGFVREMKVLVVSGAWCGDCVEQCPILLRFAEATDKIRLRFVDRDDHPDLASDLSVCGGNRVPAVLFLSEDDHPCGRYGDKTLAKYRRIVADQLGGACPTGIVPPAEELTSAVVQDWLDEFERIQLLLRTSTRLRKKHGD